MILSDASVRKLPDAVQLPGYDRSAQAAGIVHLGIGAFHRAHQAVYTDDAMLAGDRDWRIVAVSMRSPATRDLLRAQDSLYTVIEKSSGARTARIIGALERVIVAPEAPDAVVGALSDPGVHVVTLTVTEKGYYRHAATGRLQRDNNIIAAELSGGAPATIYGFLAAGLAARRASGARPLTLVSCDNLPSNGAVLAQLLGEFLDARDPGLRRWADANVACVNTMVDRIVPAVTHTDIEQGATILGVSDRALVVTEPFRQWVIEDKFKGPRPHWEAGGAQFVADVAPFELAKLRLLNGSHSSLAYIGLQLGYTYVHEAVADPELRDFVAAQVRDEAAPTLPEVEGLDVQKYIEAIFQRFANTDLQHRLRQIATDGSQKVPQRWISTIVERSAAGVASPFHINSLAAWLVYASRDIGTSGEGSDPLGDALASCRAEADGDIAAWIEAITTRFGIFPDDFTSDQGLIRQLFLAVPPWSNFKPRDALAGALAWRERSEEQ